MEEPSVRQAAFVFLDRQTAVHGDSLPRSVLSTGFTHGGRRVPLVGPQGIFKPAILDLPISILTAPADERGVRPYQDGFSEDGRYVLYRYRRSDPRHRDNAGLRRLLATRTPLVYFHGIVRGRYVAAYPAFVVADDPSSLTFVVQADQSHILSAPPPASSDEAQRRSYSTRLVRGRIHQAAFRERVINAYREMCAVCRLRHRQLLDAAHIVPDSDPRGAPTVANGLSLCKLHHAAFDGHILGIRPDLTVAINRRVLDEIDGPMLVHGIQGFHGQSIAFPRRPEWRPDRAFLEQRYEQFLVAG